MRLNQLHLFNFKNHGDFQEDFSSGINGIVGENGSGKTNVLDAIYCMSLTKSAFFSSDNQLIKDGEKFFAIRGLWSNAQLTVSLKKGEKKKITNDGQLCNKMSDHIGKFPIVFIQPDDTELVKEGSDVRRRFVDIMISQIDVTYLQKLISYNKVLKQRNSLLKHFKFHGTVDRDLLAVYDDQLISFNSFLYQKRSLYLSSIAKGVETFYGLVSGGNEKVSLTYQSQCHDEFFVSNYKASFRNDLDRERTNMGVHKDDYVFKIDGKPMKRMGSQGQKKSFVIALQLAKFKIFEDKLGIKPVLLLDDIFDKLDEKRIEQLLGLVKSNTFGQIFITDASKERFIRHIHKVTSDYNLSVYAQYTIRIKNRNGNSGFGLATSYNLIEIERNGENNIKE